MSGGVVSGAKFTWLSVARLILTVENEYDDENRHPGVKLPEESLF